MGRGGTVGRGNNGTGEQWDRGAMGRGNNGTAPYIFTLAVSSLQWRTVSVETEVFSAEKRELSKVSLFRAWTKPDQSGVRQLKLDKFVSSRVQTVSGYEINGLDNGYRCF